MPLVLYYFPPSPPCRSVLLLAKAMGLEFNMKQVNILQGEHLDAAFVKINPQHTIPTLDDNGFVLWESRAIMSYLVDQYAKDDSLYPKDPRKRALVDQRLYFDATTLSIRNSNYVGPVFFAGKAADPVAFTKIDEAVALLEKFLTGRAWVAGSSMTIADYALVATVSDAEGLGVDLSKYDNVRRWLAKAKREMEGYEEINQAGSDALTTLFKQRSAN